MTDEWVVLEGFEGGKVEAQCVVVIVAVGSETYKVRAAVTDKLSTETVLFAVPLRQEQATRLLTEAAAAADTTDSQWCGAVTRRQHREAVRLREAEETDAIKQASLSQTSGEWGGTGSLGEVGPDNDSPTLTTTGDAETSEVEGRAGSGSPGDSQTNSETSKGVTKGSHATVSSGSKGNGEACKTPPSTNSSSGEA